MRHLCLTELWRVEQRMRGRDSRAFDWKGKLKKKDGPGGALLGDRGEIWEMNFWVGCCCATGRSLRSPSLSRSCGMTSAHFDYVSPGVRACRNRPVLMLTGAIASRARSAPQSKSRIDRPGEARPPGR